MTLVKVDQKMRIRFPKKISKMLHLKGKEMLEMEVREGEIRIMRPKEADMSSFPLLKDMIENPLRSKVRITSEMLERVEEEMYL
ncbi:MAG TPA: AbrB/MazE/SpoVT family DNA-binding domain-containing protein [Candidatus Acidoferrum sp.]|nr:AbrB/MazE/SpoVT family DNA-binding domain-containing protein [Candidatus Acidoferrum sp.]